jgi:hypothetical protein
VQRLPVSRVLGRPDIATPAHREPSRCDYQPCAREAAHHSGSSGVERRKVEVGVGRRHPGRFDPAVDQRCLVMGRRDGLGVDTARPKRRLVVCSTDHRRDADPSRRRGRLVVRRCRGLGLDTAGGKRRLVVRRCRRLGLDTAGGKRRLVVTSRRLDADPAVGQRSSSCELGAAVCTTAAPDPGSAYGIADALDATADAAAAATVRIIARSRRPWPSKSSSSSTRSSSARSNENAIESPDVSPSNDSRSDRSQAMPTSRRSGSVVTSSARSTSSMSSSGASDRSASSISTLGTVAVTASSYASSISGLPTSMAVVLVEPPFWVGAQLTPHC